jgi:hypothetical protein
MVSISLFHSTKRSQLAKTLSRFALIVVAFASIRTAARADDATRADKKPIPARTAVLYRANADETVRVQQVDWSGYRGIRRYSSSYLAGYGYHPGYYYSNYAYRPWYTRPYAYAWGYPGYAPPAYRYAPYGYAGYWPGYLPYAWGGPYPPPIAAPAPLVVAPPQVSSTVPAADAEYVGCFYW